MSRSFLTTGLTMGVVLILSLVSCQSLPATAARLQSQLAEAARTEGLGIDQARTSVLVQDGSTFVGAALTGVEDIPATEYTSGVDVGFVYLAVPGRSIPAGFYRLRVTAERIGLGVVPGRTEFIDDAGNVALSRSTTVRIDSLTIPTDLQSEWAVMHAAVLMPDELNLALRRVVVRFWCTNGVHVTIVVLDYDDDDLPAG